METKKILVTGSSGFVGTRLCQKLIEAEYEVVGADIKQNKWDEAVQKRTIEVDLRDRETALELLPKDIDTVIHLAANARVYNLIADPRLAHDNVTTTCNVLEYARLADCDKFIFASSREVYGESEKITYVETDANIDGSENPYTASKISGEAFVRSYQKCFDLDYSILRFSNVYGMYDESDRIIPLFIKKCMQNEALTVFGEGKLLDFMYIDDIVAGLLSSLQNFDKVKNDVFNLSSGTGTLLTDVAELIQSSFQANQKVTVEDNRTGEVMHCIADATKIKKTLGFQPHTSIESGIKETIDWHMKNNL